MNIVIDILINMIISINKQYKLQCLISLCMNKKLVFLNNYHLYIYIYFLNNFNIRKCK